MKQMERGELNTTKPFNYRAEVSSCSSSSSSQRHAVEPFNHTFVVSMPWSVKHPLQTIAALGFDLL